VFTWFRPSSLRAASSRISAISRWQAFRAISLSVSPSGDLNVQSAPRSISSRTVFSRHAQRHRPAEYARLSVPGKQPVVAEWRLRVSGNSSRTDCTRSISPYWIASMMSIGRAKRDRELLCDQRSRPSGRSAVILLLAGAHVGAITQQNGITLRLPFHAAACNGV